jgi:type II secretory pathway pseudopilin PulG
MIVVAIIAIIAAIATPNLLAARLNANESAAIATLRSISTSEAQFQATSMADVDRDGTGEFGFFRELTSHAVVRTSPDGSTGDRELAAPVLSGAFRTIGTNGEVSRSGYVFKLFLPDSSGEAVAEPSGTTPTASFVGGTGSVDSNLAETIWCAYAWPQNVNASGNRAFFINQAGSITTNDEARFTGHGAFNVSAGRAFEYGGNDDSITGRVAVGTNGRGDSGFWKTVN